MESILVNLTGKTRRESVAGREYIVAPLSMIVHGVLNGSKGKLYYPEDETRAAADAWNGMPITVNHPSDPVTNENLPAQTPGVLQRQGVGFVKNPVWNGKLRAEGWFDVQNTRRIAPDVLKSLEAGTPIELSTGLYTDNEPTKGTFNSIPYDAIARNHQPDHLAVLPTMKGACSIDDGCGVMVNAGMCPGCNKPYKGKNCNCGYTANSMKSLWQKLGEMLGINASVHDPHSGQFTDGKSAVHAHAQKGAGTKPTPAAPDNSGTDTGGADEDKEADEQAKKELAEQEAAMKQKQLAGNANPNHDDKGRFASGSSTGADHAASASKAADKAEEEHNETIHLSGKHFAKSAEKVAKLHDKAAKLHDKHGDEDSVMGSFHRNSAADLRKSGAEAKSGKGDGFIKNQGVTMNRTQKIEVLVANCDCWKDDEATLNEFNDARIDKLYDQHVITAGAKAAYPGLVANAMPAAFKKKQERDDDSEEEGKDDDDSSTTENMKPITSRLTPEELQVWNHAKSITNNHKLALVQRLTGHLADGQAKGKLVANLAKKSIDELNDLMLLTPPTRNQEREQPLYFGNAGGEYVGNSGEQEDTDLIPEATINFKELSEENDTRNRNQRVG